jgi:hypothetical protein
MIAKMGGNDTTIIPIKKGFYQIGHFSFNSYIESLMKEQWPTLGKGFPDCFGVCDSPEQFMKKFEKRLESSKRKFVVSFTPVLKKNQEPSGGWRWHKWGPYIGTKKPTHEYLYDEPNIDAVYCFHVYELN